MSRKANGRDEMVEINYTSKYGDATLNVSQFEGGTPEIEGITLENDWLINAYIKSDCDAEGDAVIENLVQKAIDDGVSAKRIIKIVESRYKLIEDLIEEEAYEDGKHHEAFE
jgi:hypothetical protein